MRIKIFNMLICFAHFISIIILEAFLSVTIIWFLDYGSKLNVQILLCTVLALACHYSFLVILLKHRMLGRHMLNALYVLMES